MFEPPIPLRLLPIAALAVLLPACSSSERRIISQPANVGDSKLAALTYHDSGNYQRDLESVASDVERLIESRAPRAQRPALVFDIDETVLSNWEVLKRDDFGRPIEGPCVPESNDPCGWAAWDKLGRSQPIEASLRVFQKARALKVAIFFVTGRPESQRNATERNLHSAGFLGYTMLYMTPDGSHFATAADFKAPIRRKIEHEGYLIIANVGDQPSDLAGGYAESQFLLPNPFYRVP